MSCVFVIFPVIAVSWPTICSLAGVAAGVLGYKKLSRAMTLAEVEQESSQLNQVEINDEHSKLLFEQVAEEESLCFEREGIRIEISKDHRGKLKIQVKGEGKSKQELKTEGERFLAQLRRQFAYQRVMEELRKKGFQVVKEESVEGRLKIRVRRTQ